MKSRAFPKLDRPPRRTPTRSNLSTTITKKTWIEWRMTLGAGRKEALKLWHAYQEWIAQEAANGPVRYLKVEPWQDWEREFRAFLDEMPRKPYGFLAMVAETEKQRAHQQAIQARKAEGRERYFRRYARRASPARKISRQAEHGTGEILGTGVREQCKAQAGSGGLQDRNERLVAVRNTVGVQGPALYKAADTRASFLTPDATVGESL